MADTTSLHLRLPKRLYKRLHQQARRNNVSLNTEIVNQLEGRETATAARMAESLKPALDAAIREAIKMAVERRDWLGAPVKPWEVIPLNNPIPETPEPKVPLPEKKTEPETVKSEEAEKK